MTPTSIDLRIVADRESIPDLARLTQAVVAA
jgi:hypothetical protein